MQQQVVPTVAGAMCETAVPDFRKNEVAHTVEIIGVVLSGVQII